MSDQERILRNELDAVRDTDRWIFDTTGVLHPTVPLEDGLPASLQKLERQLLVEEMLLNAHPSLNTNTRGYAVARSSVLSKPFE